MSRNKGRKSFVNGSVYRNRKANVKWIGVLVGILLCHMPIQAKELVDTSATCSLSLQLSEDETDFIDTVVTIYKLADVDSFYEFDLIEEFETCDIEVNAETESLLAESTSNVSAYITEYDIISTASEITDENGTVVFQNLTVGMYMVNVDSYTSGDSIYIVDSFIVKLPLLEENGSYLYDVTAKPKSSSYATVSNTILSTEEPTTEEPTTEESVIEVVQETVIQTIGKTLPQTGMLRWPIYILACTGLCMIIVGIYLTRTESKQKRKVII